MRTRARTGDRAGQLLRAIPNWDDVRIFLAIQRAGSLSAAAGPLGIAQPTCGRRLAALEASIGARLFDRTPDGLRITADGAALLAAASAMEEAARALAVAGAGRDRDLEGVVRIATTELLAISFLVDALRTLREAHPAIRVELVLSNAESDLLAREADLALRFGPEGSRPRPDVLVAQKLGDEPFELYGADAYVARRGAPADPAALAGHDVIVYSAPNPASAWCSDAFRGANVVLAAPSMLVSSAAVAAGLGLGVVPRRAARRFPQLRPLSPVIARGTGWIVLHPDLRRVPRIRVVADALARTFRATAT
ncbi:MAG TPA: LysR family transcriptional regulator [Anaeromyxobacter sp.]|nr:LysR family transcriptional regulator [Anaeromyxobacter sp.]